MLAALPGTAAAGHLRGRLHAEIRPPVPMRMVDLRDQALVELGIDRSAVVSSDAQHYPCTRRVARMIHDITAPLGPSTASSGTPAKRR